MATLITHNKKEFILSEQTINQLITIKHMLEDIPGKGKEKQIELSNIYTSYFDLVVKYCVQHENDIVFDIEKEKEKAKSKGKNKEVNDKGEQKDGKWVISEWDQKFLDDLNDMVMDDELEEPDETMEDIDTELAKKKAGDRRRFKLMNLADYLSLKGLIKLIAKYTANEMYGKTPDEIEERFECSKIKFEGARPLTQEEKEERLKNIKWIE